MVQVSEEVLTEQLNLVVSIHDPLTLSQVAAPLVQHCSPALLQVSFVIGPAQRLVLTLIQVPLHVGAGAAFTQHFCSAIAQVSFVIPLPPSQDLVWESGRQVPLHVGVIILVQQDSPFLLQVSFVILPAQRLLLGLIQVPLQVGTIGAGPDIFLGTQQTLSFPPGQIFLFKSPLQLFGFPHLPPASVHAFDWVIQQTLLVPPGQIFLFKSPLQLFGFPQTPLAFVQAAD